MGVPAVYNQAVVTDILEGLVNGLSYKEVAAKVGISTSTLHQWRKTKPDFDRLCRRAINEHIQNEIPSLQRALYGKAVGCKVTEKKTEYVSEVVMNEDGSLTEIVKQKKVTEIEKDVPPDTMATIFALTNLEPDKWKKRSSQEISESKNVQVSVKKEEVARLELTTEQLEMLDSINTKVIESKGMEDTPCVEELTEKDFREFRDEYDKQ